MEEQKQQAVNRSNGSNGSNVGLVVACSLLGLCAGAVVGLLYAPRPGKEVRSMIVNSVKAAKAEFK